VSRYHPSQWPLYAWVALALVAGLLRVDYTSGSFSFAPAVALLAGTWLGSNRAALTQLLAGLALVPIAWVQPQIVNPAEWGFRVGLIATAALAGAIARPDGNGAHPRRAIRLAVFGIAGVTGALVFNVVPRITSGENGVLFTLAFLMGTALASFYGYRMVPEPGRVIGYAFCLAPYYLAGVAWTALLSVFMPATAALAGIRSGWRETVFHAYLAHLPGDLIAVVVIAYLVCAIDRGGTASGPLAIGASR